MKSVSVSVVSPSICLEVMGLDVMIRFSNLESQASFFFFCISVDISVFSLTDILYTWCLINSTVFE